jgi:hypothetical protein
LAEENRYSLSNLFLYLALAVLVLVLTASFSHYAGHAREGLGFPYPLDYGEGPILDQTLRLAAGENIYRNDFSTPPYTISNYPPLFMLAQVPFTLGFGPAFWYGRLISLVCALLSALFIGLTIYQLSGDRVASVIGGLLLLTFPYVQYWSLLNRIDLLALALSTAGLYVITARSDRHWGVALAAGLAVAAIFTRQSYALAMPFGAFVWLLSMRRFNQAIRFFLYIAGATLVLFLVLNTLSRGGFYLNIITANVNPFNWQVVTENLITLATNTFYLLLLIAVFLVAERAGTHTRSWPLALPYFFAASISATTIGKEGSNVNYMLELSAAMCLAGGAAIAWMGRYNWLRAIVVLVLVIQVGSMIDWMRLDFDGRLTEKFVQRRQLGQVFEIVQQTEGIVLADEYMGLIPLAGKRLYFQPFEFKQMADGRVWDESQFLDSIRDGEFDLILMYQPYSWPAVASRWTVAMRNTVRRFYSEDDNIAFNLVYRPRR